MKETTRTSARLFLQIIAAVYVLAYLVRWIYLSYYLSTSTVLTDVSPDWNLILPLAFQQAFIICSTVFGVFFLTSFTTYRLHDGYSVSDYREPTRIMALTLISLVVFTLIIRRIFGSVLGEEPADIPLGLGTPIFRAQSDLFPGLFLLFAEAAWFARKRRSHYFWIVALAFFNIAMSLLTTSKAGLIFFAVQLFMLLYLTERKMYSKPLRIVALVVASLAVFIVAAQLRSRALLGVDALIVVSLMQGNIVETLLEVVGLIANRLPGTEGLALYCGFDCSGLPAFSVPRFTGEAGRVFTQAVLNVKSEFDFRSPGYVGGAVIIAGLAGGSLLSVVFLQMLLVLFRLLDKQRVSAATKIVLCFGSFRFILEGVWAWQDVASMAASALVVEMVARSLLYGGSHSNSVGSWSQGTQQGTSIFRA